MGRVNTPLLSEATFRGLARSAPWRFSTLHFTHTRRRGPTTTEAWLRRPGHLTVRDGRGLVHAVEGVPYSMATFSAVGRQQPWTPSPPQGMPVRLDRDGFVIERPEADYDDPLWGSFHWVAMLDPVELSSGTVVGDLAETLRDGRRTWWARMAASAGYEPRCGCCPLLWGQLTEEMEGRAGGPTVLAREPDVVYPESWLVGLDVQTGVLVSLEPVGGSRDDLGVSVVIHDVDAVLRPPTPSHPQRT